jgi:hypothetical protein
MSTLAVVEAILREAAMPLSVREIVERAGDGLPTRSKTPDTVVARDLSMDIKRKSDGSTFVRTSPGRYAIRELAQAQGRDAEDQQATESAPVATAPAITTATAPLSAIAPIAPQTLSDSNAPTPLVGQSLPHDRNGTRPAPAKPQSNSEDTPMSA